MFIFSLSEVLTFHYKENAISKDIIEISIDIKTLYDSLLILDVFIWKFYGVPWKLIFEQNSWNNKHKNNVQYKMLEWNVQHK